MKKYYVVYQGRFEDENLTPLSLVIDANFSNSSANEIDEIIKNKILTNRQSNYIGSFAILSMCVIN